MELILKNLNSKEIKMRNDKWQFCIGNCHAALLLRKDMVEHLKKVHEETGIEFIRFHGLFDDDMLVIQRLSDYSYFKMMPFSRSIYEYNFLNVKKVIDNVLECGFKPFVELSFMPEALAKKKKYGLRYKNNISVPKSYEKYYKFIHDFGEFLVEHYGKEEIETWKFEVWNEPDLGIFFNGSQKDYFKLYKNAYKALKDVDPKLEVGGPSTSKCKWLKEFAEYGEKNGCKADFITTHHYVGDAFGNTFEFKDSMSIIKKAHDAKKAGLDIETTYEKFFYKKDKYVNWPKSMFKKMDKKAHDEIPNYPLYITEWSTMAVYCSPYHDDKVAATFALKYALEMDDSIAGASYWCASDIFEESFIHNKPFYGGYGIINNVGIPKPVFYAFKLLNNLSHEELVLDKNEENEVEYHLYKKDSGYELLVFNQDFDIDKKLNEKVDVTIEGNFKEVNLYRIDKDHVNPKKEWIKLGAKKLLLDEEVKEIIEKSKPKKEKVNFTSDGNSTKLSFVAEGNSIYLYEFFK